MGDELQRMTLREWRTLRLLTQEELGEKVGVTHFTISNWELGIKQPRFKNLRALAQVLAIQPDQIVLTKGKGAPVAA